jgi:LPXTG-site transpeptidase (sortase) family protein
MVKRYRWWITAGGATLLVLIAVLLHAHQTDVAVYSVKAVTYSTSKPSEKPIPKASYNWKGGAADPKFINLPTISASGFVQFMGVDQNKQIATPTNVNFAGWYVNSVLPGQVGLSVIVGHVDGLTSPGIFYHLDALKTGDEFTVERGDGTMLSYQVKSTTAVSTADAVNVLFSQNPGIQSQLNLITCGGVFNRASKEYEKRIIVTAALTGTLPKS